MFIVDTDSYVSFEDFIVTRPNISNQKAPSNWRFWSIFVDFELKISVNPEFKTPTTQLRAQETLEVVIFYSTQQNIKQRKNPDHEVQAGGQPLGRLFCDMRQRGRRPQ